MRIPQWTATDSLGDVVGRYRCQGSRGATASLNRRVTPQLWSWKNRFPEFEMMDRIAVPPSCDLHCGAKRSDCFRGGGSTEVCNRDYSHCLMECFFAGGGRSGGYIV